MSEKKEDKTDEKTLVIDFERIKPGPIMLILACIILLSCDNYSHLAREFTVLFLSIILLIFCIAVDNNSIENEDTEKIVGKRFGIYAQILKVLIIRYSFGLCVGLLLFFLLATYQYNHLFRIIITISLILPVGLAVIPFSTEFGYDEKLVSIITTISIIISFFLMWILILLLNG